MQKTLDTNLTVTEAAKIISAIEEYDRAILRLFKKMDKDQVEIERLKIETRRMLAQMRSA